MRDIYAVGDDRLLLVATDRIRAFDVVMAEAIPLKGVVLTQISADAKFEFGRAPDGAILLIDEVMTPDSSRFWPAGRYRPGGPQPSFDKQPLRDWLDAERRAGRWNGEAPAASATAGNRRSDKRPLQ